MAALSEAEGAEDAQGGEGVRGLVKAAADREPLNAPAHPKGTGQRGSKDCLRGGPAKAAPVCTEAGDCELVAGSPGRPVVG